MKDWKNWAKCAGIRAIKTVAQTAVATIGTATALGQVDAKLVVSASVLAGILSLLTSIAGLPECNTEGEIIVLFFECATTHGRRSIWKIRRTW